VSDTAWCNCGLLAQKKAGSTARGDFTICNKCARPYFDEAMSMAISWSPLVASESPHLA
jgi:hypothetical protein